MSDVHTKTLCLIVLNKKPYNIQLHLLSNLLTFSSKAVALIFDRLCIFLSKKLLYRSGGLVDFYFYRTFCITDGFVATKQALCNCFSNIHFHEVKQNENNKFKNVAEALR